MSNGAQPANAVSPGQARRPWLGAIGLVLALLDLVVAAFTGWYGATATVGFALFFYGLFAYLLVGIAPFALAIIALARGERRVLAIVALVLLVLGGPASCVGGAALKERCQHATYSCW